MLRQNIFRPPLNDKNRIAILTSLKGTTEINTHNLCLQKKLTTDWYGRNNIKTPSKIPRNMSIFFVAAQNY